MFFRDVQCFTTWPNYYCYLTGNTQCCWNDWFVFFGFFSGESGLGKSTLINSLFLTDLYSAEYPGPSHRIKKTVQVRLDGCLFFLSWDAVHDAKNTSICPHQPQLAGTQKKPLCGLGSLLCGWDGFLAHQQLWQRSKTPFWYFNFKTWPQNHQIMLRLIAHLCYLITSIFMCSQLCSPPPM